MRKKEKIKKEEEKRGQEESESEPACSTWIKGCIKRASKPWHCTLMESLRHLAPLNLALAYACKALA
jgi:hypothetical protein